MTRIRFIEWFLAAILVIALHGAALTGWVWIAPKSPLAELPAALPAPSNPESQDTAPIDIVVNLIEPDQSPEQTVANVPAAVQPVEPSAPAPAIEPQSPNTVVLQNGTADPDKDTSQISVVSPDTLTNDDQIPDASSSELPPLEELPNADASTIEPATPSETAAPEPAATPAPAASSPLRDPVPIPKVKPASAPRRPKPEAPATPPATTEQQVASTQPEQPATADQPVSAAQTVYYRQLIAKITKARVYPSTAKRAGKEGTVYMQIVVKRNGRIASYDIIKSSGHKELDDAAVQTLVRVNPVSPFPDEVTQEELRIGVPLRYQVDPS